RLPGEAEPRRQQALHRQAAHPRRDLPRLSVRAVTDRHRHRLKIGKPRTGLCRSTANGRLASFASRGVLGRPQPRRPVLVGFLEEGWAKRAAKSRAPLNRGRADMATSRAVTSSSNIPIAWAITTIVSLWH